MTKNYVKFVGKFTDLIPQGFTFWKAYARNYRVYTIRPNGEEYGQSINVWQHHGGYVEIGDLDMVISAELVRLILDGTIDKIPHRSNFYSMVVDMETDTLLQKDYKIHDAFVVSSDLPKAQRKEALDKFYKKWREALIKVDVVNFVKEMLNKKQIEIRPFNSLPK